jgi:hypothetical protein
MKASRNDKIYFLKFLHEDIRYLSVEIFTYKLGAMIIFLCIALSGLLILNKQSFSLIDFGVILVQFMIIILFSRHLDHALKLQRKEREFYTSLLGGVCRETYKKN